MKKVWLILLIVFSMVGIFALKIPNIDLVKVDGQKIMVVASLPLVKDLVAKIGGSAVTVDSIVHGLSCDHEYEASARDMKKLANSAIFVKLGMGSDIWADKLAAGIAGKKTKIIDSSQGVKVLKVNGFVNPHYWGSPANVKIMAQNITNALSAVSPGQKAYFNSNYQKFVRELDLTANNLKTKVAVLKNKKVISYSGAFPYFLQYFGFDNLETVETVHEREVSPKDIINAVKIIKRTKVRILIGDAVEPKEPGGLARETNSKIILLWGATDESGDYLKTMRHNVETLVAELQ